MASLSLGDKLSGADRPAPLSHNVKICSKLLHIPDWCVMERIRWVTKVALKL